ncbi:hypothetical protein F5J12DRAFT_924937 [Pisolithus orientalis]|uniref:uncharacterized protein n=1 Tax=Pisolithus orientalis TaxID=936130 RepID=UPI002224F18C|nr:uncharacterized protein F5J12DRAFT_924937 [Pisolithus orientalis]KAI6030557.1 hypothetical protein F5J12DRAFT_924937 [Pisolithus orientalis]
MPILRLQSKVKSWSPLTPLRNIRIRSRFDERYWWPQALEMMSFSPFMLCSPHRRMVFVLEGILTAVISLIAYLLAPTWSFKAKFVRFHKNANMAERERLLERLRINSNPGMNQTLQWSSVRQAFGDHLVWNGSPSKRSRRYFYMENCLTVQQVEPSGSLNHCGGPYGHRRWG